MRIVKFPLDRQLDKMDCGPSCLKMIAKYYGKYYSLPYLRDLCGNTKEGVSLAGISHAAEVIGIRSLALRCEIDDLIFKVPLPVIVHWDNNHFIVIYDIKKRRNGEVFFHISDPAKGYIKCEKTEFEDKWIKKNESRNLGVVLVLEPQADFKQRQVGEKSERGRLLENLSGYFMPYKNSFYYLGITMLLITAMQAALPFISKAVIDVGIQTKDVSFINIVLFANLALIVSITLSSAVRDWILQHISSRINIALISDYLIKLMKLPVSFFENKMLGDILQRANDHERIRSFIMNNSLNLIFSSLTFVIFSLVLLIYNSTIFYIFLIGSMLYKWGVS
ncbi:cysteine peptidase family C39 domain-containing protein [Sphingobacterium sp. UBA6320]|jgi:ATP-binding cassette subfamily B protein|uniref:cysteine peptidase family C39 domain-containing protein n=1 Tax=Sphingobacterium sp. UBA6320 TaxID=1947510 RepID=UPI0025D76189|nr:cysteine peptidase family C39 domain-containing protein [Sphingobacterium sp. UBA6320]